MIKMRLPEGIMNELGKKIDAIARAKLNPAPNITPRARTHAAPRQIDKIKFESFLGGIRVQNRVTSLGKKFLFRSRVKERRFWSSFAIETPRENHGIHY